MFVPLVAVNSVLKMICWVVLIITADMCIHRYTIYSAFNTPGRLSEICIILLEIFWVEFKPDYGIIQLGPCIVRQSSRRIGLMYSSSEL